VDSAITTGTTNLLAGTNAWTGTNSFNTNLPTSTQTPTTSTQLTTKTYVDSAITTGSSSLLASKNVWTNENDFTNIVKVQTPSISSSQNLDLYSADNSIVINGAPGTTSALSGVNLNTNTLTVPIKNNQSLIRIRIPMNIAGFGVPSFYFGQLDIIFNSITAITILKNGSFYKTVTFFELLNFTGTTKSWTGWSQKGENARAYVGDVRFELALTTGNTSVDTYTIGIAVDVAVNAGAVGLITPRFLCTGDVNFTTTHATTSTGTTYISTDPASYFPYQINFGNSGNYIIGKGDIFLKTIDGGALNIDAWTYVEMKAQNGIDVLAGNADLNLKTLTSGDVNIQSFGATNINSGANTSIQTGVAGGLISLKVSDGTTAIEIQDVTASAQYQESYIVIPETSRINIIPEGTILTSVVATAPEGYVLCNGGSYSSTNVASNKYRRLFNAIGYTFGGSGGSFNVPNFQGAFLRGSGSQTVGGVSYAGNAVGNNPQQDAVLNPLYASNEGYFNTTSGGAVRHCVARDRITADPVDTNTGILPRFDRTATENRPFNFTVFYYIKF
jgi:microcystin-dependent protein